MLWTVHGAGLGWGSFLWGFAVAHAPLYARVMQPLLFPLVVYLLFLSQIGFLAAGASLALGAAGLATLGWIALAVAVVSSVLEPTRAWLAIATPD